MTRIFAFMLIGLWLSGCELVADFDRSKIPQAHADAGARDAGRATDASHATDAKVADGAAITDAASSDDGGGDDAGGR